MANRQAGGWEQLWRCSAHGTLRRRLEPPPTVAHARGADEEDCEQNRSFSPTLRRGSGCCCRSRRRHLIALSACRPSTSTRTRSSSRRA